MSDNYIAWGKISRESGAAHPLIFHMLDVAACFNAVTEVGSVRRALERLAGRPLLAVDISRLCALAFLHDIGKANAGFQAKRWSGSLSVPPEWPRAAGHVSEALGVFRNDNLLSQLPIAQMDLWGSSCLSLWHASISHHGRPVEESTFLDHKRVWEPVVKGKEVIYDPRSGLAEIGKSLQTWFQSAFEVGPALPNSAEFAHLFAGLVQFSDWIGSDERVFPYAQIGENRNAWIWQRAKDVIKTIGFDVKSWQTALPKNLDFTSVFEVSSLRPIQAKMAEMSEPEIGSLLILEAETGSGKTEAALMRFAKLFQSGKVDGLYFALPTRVAASQIYNRTLQFASNLWKGTSLEPPLVVRALPGYESADGQAIIRLPDFKVLWPDHPDDQKAHTRWAAETSKRYLAAPLAVGTIDQALLATLQVRHAHMRHSLLIRSLLVVDEVHASDAYMSTLLAHLLKAHLNGGGHALLLSATLGSSARLRYQRLVSPDQPMLSLEQALALPYPAITDGASLYKVPKSDSCKRVYWHVKGEIDNPESIASMAIEAASHGAKVLVIRNTVPAALATFREIEKMSLLCGLQNTLFHLDGIATVHHSRYSREDRPRLDAAIERQIGKHREKPLQACIAVGTQTLEQSLDIDADFLITDLCPMDVLLQRVGRLHRHDRSPEARPENFRQARAVVLVPADHKLDVFLKRSRHGLGRFHNGGGIYTDMRVLEATKRLISNSVSHLIPQDNRELVERSTHPDILQKLADDLGEDWLIHGQAVDGETQAEKVHAKLNVLPFNQHFVESDVNGRELSTLQFTGKDQKISSRLGAGDYLLSFVPAQAGPFMQKVASLPMRDHLWPRGESPDTQPVVQTTEIDGSFTFTLGKTRYRYSRLGLELIRSTTNGVSP